MSVDDTIRITNTVDHGEMSGRSACRLVPAIPAINAKIAAALESGPAIMKLSELRADTTRPMTAALTRAALIPKGKNFASLPEQINAA